MSRAGRTLLCSAAWALLSTAPASARTVTSHVPAPDSSAVLVTVGGRSRLTVAEVVRRFRQDHSGLPADSITPARVAGFLELMADEAALVEAAARADLPWTPPDSAAHRALRDRLVMRIVLDSVLAEARDSTSPDTARDTGALGLAARQRVVAGLHPTYDDSLVARLAGAWSRLPKPSSDSSLEAQLRLLGGLPLVNPDDTNRVVARSRAGEVLARDVLGPWSRLSVAYRPRIETPAQVRDLIDNALFERALRRRAARIDPEAHPGVRAVLEAHAERLSLARLLDRDVLADVRAEPRVLAAWFAARESLWALPVRVRGVRLSLSERAAADRMALTLRDPAAAESLVVRARRRGIDYRFEITAATDSELFRAAHEAGTGVVSGPWQHEDGWRVARVEEILPARRRGLDEVRDQVEAAWRSEHAERRTRALAARHRKALRVVVHADALPEAVRRLRKSLAAGATHAERSE